MSLGTRAPLLLPGASRLLPSASQHVLKLQEASAWGRARVSAREDQRLRGGAHQEGAPRLARRDAQGSQASSPPPSTTLSQAHSHMTPGRKADPKRARCHERARAHMTPGRKGTRPLRRCRQFRLALFRAQHPAAWLLRFTQCPQTHCVKTRGPLIRARGIAACRRHAHSSSPQARPRAHSIRRARRGEATRVPP